MRRVCQDKYDHILYDNGNYPNNHLQHIISLHEGLAYVCNECDLTETQLDNIYNHIRTSQRGKRYSCNQCEYKVTHKGTQKLHITS